MYMIVCTCKEFGKGYYIGMNLESAIFQSCVDNHVKKYKTRDGAERQLKYITEEPDDAEYAVEEIREEGNP